MSPSQRPLPDNTLTRDKHPCPRWDSNPGSARPQTSVWSQSEIFSYADNLAVNAVYRTLMNIIRVWLTHKLSALYTVALEGHLKSLFRLRVLSYLSASGSVWDCNCHRIIRVSYFRRLSQLLVLSVTTSNYLLLHSDTLTVLDLFSCQYVGVERGFTTKFVKRKIMRRRKWEEEV
jgi:hypothetical protein